jgi:hypothetical protein
MATSMSTIRRNRSRPAAYVIAPGKAPHQGTRGKRALFLHAPSTQGVLVEITGK